MRKNRVIDKTNYKNKNTLAGYALFLMLIVFITSIVTFYISNNIVLTELGYKLIELENNKIILEEQNKKFELTIETLSALDRIEKLACNHLGMIRPKEVKFIALLPNPDINPVENIGVISNNYPEEKYFWASFNLKELNDLILSGLK